MLLFNIKKKIKKLSKYINFFIKDKYIYLSGPLGLIKYKINNKFFYILGNNLFILKKQNLLPFFKDFEKLVIGVMYGWYFSLNIYGRGFSFKLINKNNMNYLRIKIGYSHFIYYSLPNNLFLKINKKKNKIFIFSLNFWEISKLANQIRFLRSKHTYKIQGITFVDENIIIKPGKQKQT